MNNNETEKTWNTVKKLLVIAQGFWWGIVMAQ